MGCIGLSLVRDWIVRDGILKGWGFHIFKIAGNFNFPLIIIIIIILSDWFYELEKNWACRAG